MDKNELTKLLRLYKTGDIPEENILRKLRQKPFIDIGFASVDLHRELRNGAGEVLYGEGKTAEQIVAIVNALNKEGQDDVLITRLSEDKANKIKGILNIDYNKTGRIAVTGKTKSADGNGKIVIACAGTSDLSVAEETRVTAEFLGNETICLTDVGVAGLHRLLAHLDELMSATVVIAIAGMEGALASVIGGLVDVPVIAVPTSVGYGASFGGISALLAMLNSCASGVSVVNIDNGFGAAYQASMINHSEVGKHENVVF